MLRNILLIALLTVSTLSAAFATDLPFAADCNMYGTMNPVLPTTLAPPRIPKSLKKFTQQIDACASTKDVNFADRYTLCQGEANFILDRVSKDVYRIPVWAGIKIEVGCNLITFNVGNDTHYRVWDSKTHTLGVPTDSTD